MTLHSSSGAGSGSFSWRERRSFERIARELSATDPRFEAPAIPFAGLSYSGSGLRNALTAGLLTLMLGAFTAILALVLLGAGICIFVLVVAGVHSRRPGTRRES